MANTPCPPCSEVLRAVFPLLSGPDLASCLCVCHQWRDLAMDDHLWRSLCFKRWPSIASSTSPHHPPIGARHGYLKLFSTFFKPRRSRSSPLPQLSFVFLELYVDIWLDSTPVYSAVVPGSHLPARILNPPPEICQSMRDHLQSSSYKISIPVFPHFEVSFSEKIHVSLLARRCDRDQVACIIDKSGFDYVDGPGYKAHAYDFLQFSPLYPFVSDVRAWVGLLLVDSKEGKMKVFGMELDFGEVADSDEDVLLLLDILDWK